MISWPADDVLHYPSLCLGAHFTISSTLKIISAASVAETSACSFTRRHSVMPSSFILSTLPENIFKPASASPPAMAARRFCTISAESYPALSAMIVGSYLRARAIASTARACLPSTDLASSSTARAILTSAFPPPYMVL